MVRGSAAIYGCEPAAPSFFSEEMARSLPLRTRFQRDIGELEAYFENFARRQPALTCCMLRYQPEIGPDLDSPLSRYLALPVVPTQLGFDPRLQMLHSDDASEALRRATMRPVRGAVNVAPSGSVSLTRALRHRRAYRVADPAPAVRPGADPSRAAARSRRALRGRGPAAPLRPRRRQPPAAHELGFEPRFDAVGAVLDLADRGARRRLMAIPGPAALASALGGLVGERR